jgi:Holliday junction resolvase
MAMNAKGSRRERELLEKLNKEGFVAHRIAGSGVGENAICDLIAIKGGIPHFFEVKSRKKVYYPKEHTGQLKGMMDAAKNCGAKAILAVKLNYKEWQFFDLHERGIPEKVS